MNVNKIMKNKNDDPYDFELPELTDAEYIAGLGEMKERISLYPDPSWDQEEKESRMMYLSSDVLVDPNDNIVFKKGKVILLSPAEAKLLTFMMKNYNAILSRRKLEDQYDWYSGRRVFPDSVSKIIHRMRRKLNQNTVDGFVDRPYIVTLHSIGYKWNYSTIQVYRIHNSDVD